jgi:murein DD-endopeptidase MepM/ murein hydrolase activator NlpD
MKQLTILFAVVTANICIAQGEYSVRDLKAGRFEADSSHIYRLPFENKKRVFLIQAYQSKMSHRGEMALDFKIKKQTRVCAARDGIVIAARADSDKGGLKPANLNDGNYVSIRHADGSIAHYWHLDRNGAMVVMGDSVKTGQLIGLSGNSGYSAFPHLHFEVVGYDANGNFTQIPTRFYTDRGVIYLRPGQFYKVVH